MFPNIVKCPLGDKITPVENPLYQAEENHLAGIMPPLGGNLHLKMEPTA